MSRTLLRHAHILTLDPQGCIFPDAEVAIADGLITSVGATPSDFVADEVVDATDHIVMPGFFNAHTHSPLALGRAGDLARWFDPRASRRGGLEMDFAACLDPEDVYWGAALAVAGMIRSGIAGFADHFFWMDRVAEVVLASGLRANLAWCTFGRDGGEIGADLQGISDFVERWQAADGGRIRTSLGPHSPYACSPKFLARTAAVAARMGVGIHLHLAESQEQVARSVAEYDLTPVEVLDRNGVLDVPVSAAHGIYLSEADREILAARAVTIVQCPTVHMRLGMGVTPVPALLAAGINVALGTDGDLTMFQEARNAVLAQRLYGLEPKQLAGDAALRMATQHAAQAMGFPLSGELAAGHAADLILIDCQTPRLAAWLRHGPVASMLYAAEAGDVSDIMVAGRWLMRRRVLLTLDEERILCEARKRGG